MSAGLHADMRLKIVTRDRAFGPDDDEPAFGLRLRDPGIGEGAPARLEFGEAAAIPAHRDRMLIDLEAVGLVDDRRHLQRRLAVQEPGAERCAIAEIVEQAAAPRGLAVPPRRRFLAPDLVFRHDDLVGAVKQRAAIAVVEMHLEDFADGALVDQTLGCDMRGIPAQRPVDRQPNARLLTAARIRSASFSDAAKGFSSKMSTPSAATASTQSACRAVAGQRSRGPASSPARNVRFRNRRARWGCESLHRVDHTRADVVADANDFRVRMLVRLAQQVAHVDVLEADADDAPFSHFRSPLRSRAAISKR